MILEILSVPSSTVVMNLKKTLIPERMHPKKNEITARHILLM